MGKMYPQRGHKRIRAAKMPHLGERERGHNDGKTVRLRGSVGASHNPFLGVSTRIELREGKYGNHLARPDL